MDSFGGIVCDELGGGVVGVEFDLVYCWDDLFCFVSSCFFYANSTSGAACCHLPLLMGRSVAFLGS